MAGFSNEFRVGLFAILALGAVGYGILRVDDVPDNATGERWHVYADFPSVQGVFVTTPVRIAGVTVGSIEDIELVGDHARVRIGFLGNVSLATDSVANMVGEGVLGDKALVVTPGVAPTLLKEGDQILVGKPPPDIGQITTQVSDIATNVKKITEDVLEISGDDSAYRAEILATLQNVRLLSERLNDIAGQNDQRIAEIAQNLLEVSQALKAVVARTGDDVGDEMAAIRKATETLDRTLKNVEAISESIRDGEGTVGKLVKETSTIDKVNTTIDNVNGAVEEVQGLLGDVSKLETKVSLKGDYYVGSQPTVAGLDENPVAGGARTGVGIRLQPAEDHWYEIELVSHPLGAFSREDVYYPDSGASYTQVTSKPSFRTTLQMAHRFDDLVLRFGMKESTGGVGADYLFFHDRLQLSADLYDFAYASWPKLDGTPNLQVNLRAEPWPHFYLEGGMDNLIFNSRYGFATGYFGGGIQFTDDDLKYILAAAPVKP